MIPTQTNPPQNRDLTGGFIAGQNGNPGGHPVGFSEQIKESTMSGSELVEVVLSVLRDANASNRERMDAATWLADRDFGKPVADKFPDTPGIGDFTIMSGDHDARGNPSPDSSWSQIRDNKW
jgi:hypothetical protein